MKYEPHLKGDVLLITGIGKVYPFMRSHKILDNILYCCNGGIFVF